PLAKYFFSTSGVPNTFIYFAIIFTAVCVVGSFFLKNPPKDYLPKNYKPSAEKSASIDYPAGKMVKTSSFYAITISLLLAVPAYFIISPLIGSIGQARGLSPDVATVVAVMMLSLFNSAGRIIAPWISDKVGRKKTIYILMAGTIAAILLFIIAQGWFVLVLVSVTAFCYGGYLGIYPALTNGFFGMKNAGVNYGIVLIGFGIAAIFTPFMVKWVNIGTDYTVSFIVAAVLAALAMVVAIFIKKPKAL
ncbi:MAG: MFS transporter, partial [Eubacteriales bacterium]